MVSHFRAFTCVCNYNAPVVEGGEKRGDPYAMSAKTAEKKNITPYNFFFLTIFVCSTLLISVIDTESTPVHSRVSPTYSLYSDPFISC